MGSDGDAVFSSVPDNVFKAKSRLLAVSGEDTNQMMTHTHTQLYTSLPMYLSSPQQHLPP